MLKLQGCQKVFGITFTKSYGGVRFRSAKEKGRDVFAIIVPMLEVKSITRRELEGEHLKENKN